MNSALLEIYSQDRTFLDCFADDLQDGAVWYNSSEFARMHMINGAPLLSIFLGVTENRVKIVTPKDSPFNVNDVEGVFFCRAQDIRGIRPERLVEIDGKRYQIGKADLLQGQVWRLELYRVQEN